MTRLTGTPETPSALFSPATADASPFAAASDRDDVRHGTMVPATTRASVSHRPSLPAAHIPALPHTLMRGGTAHDHSMIGLPTPAQRAVHEWGLYQIVRLMQAVDPAHCPPALPGRLVALGLPAAAARAFFTFTALVRTPDLRHHAIALFARMEHTTRTQLLQAANLPAARAREIADAFAAQMLRDVNTPLQTAALLMVLALRPTPGDLMMLVDERFASPLLGGMISSSLRYDEAKVFMHDPLHRKVHTTVELNNLRSANSARHVELLDGYLARHGRMLEGHGDLLGNYLRDVAGDTELPDETTARAVARGQARHLIGPESTSAVARTMGQTSTERLGTLLSHGVAVDIPDAHGFTALHYAIAALDVEKVRLLLQHFANPLRQPVGLLHKFSDTLRKRGGTLHGLPPHKPLKFAEKLFERLDSPVQQARLAEIIDLLKARAAHMRQPGHE